MGDDKAPQEPSMEEILASIRRIISEDGDVSAAASSPESNQHEIPTKSSAEESSVKPSSEDFPEEDEDTDNYLDAKKNISSVLESSSAESDSQNRDVLDLTEMVSDDGFVVPLSAISVDEALETAHASLDEALETASASFDEALETANIPDNEQEQSINSIDDLVADMADDFPEFEAAADEAFKPDFSDDAEHSDEETSVQAVKDALESGIDSPSATLEKPIESEELTKSKSKPIVSDLDAPVPIAAFKQLQKAVQAKKNQAADLPPPRPGSALQSLTVDQLVTEAVRPLIKEWLDNNLQSLVERMVAQEMKRLTSQIEE